MKNSKLLLLDYTKLVSYSFNSITYKQFKQIQEDIGIVENCV